MCALEREGEERASGGGLSNEIKGCVQDNFCPFLPPSLSLTHDELEIEKLRWRREEEE